MIAEILSVALTLSIAAVPADDTAKERSFVTLDVRDKPLEGWFGGVEMGSALLTATVDGSLRSTTGTLGLRGGYRTSEWGYYLTLEESIWQTQAKGNDTHVEVATNFGAGFEAFHFGGAARTAFTLGLSLLSRGNEINDAGELGFYFDVRPVAVRWALTEELTLTADPVHMVVMLPVLSGIPLVEVQYRTTIAIEFM